jgi:hypothetical protein
MKKLGGNNMKANVYQLRVAFGGVIGMVHGHYGDIVELYIPSLDVAINTEEDGTWHCFEVHEGQSGCF